MIDINKWEITGLNTIKISNHINAEVRRYRNPEEPSQGTFSIAYKNNQTGTRRISKPDKAYQLHIMGTMIAHRIAQYKSYLASAGKLDGRNAFRMAVEEAGPSHVYEHVISDEDGMIATVSVFDDPQDSGDAYFKIHYSGGMTRAKHSKLYGPTDPCDLKKKVEEVIESRMQTMRQRGQY